MAAFNILRAHLAILHLLGIDENIISLVRENDIYTFILSSIYILINIILYTNKFIFK